MIGSLILLAQIFERPYVRARTLISCLLFGGCIPIAQANAIDFSYIFHKYLAFTCKFIHRNIANENQATK